MPVSVGYAAWAFAAGIAIPVMAILNAGLARSLGGAAPASLVLLAVGLASAAAVTLLFGFALPRPGRFAGVSPFLFGGGCIVAGYILSVTSLAPRFGVTNTVLFVVCAQVVAAAVIDDRGLLGAPVRPVTSLRLVGLCVVLAGVAVSQVGAATSKGAP